MPAEIFCRGVYYQIDAELQRPLVIGSCEGGIDERLHAMAPADLSEAFQVNDVVVRVGRRLTYQHSRGRANRLFHRFVVARRYDRYFHAVAMQHLGEELPRPAIRVVGYDDVGIM